MNLIRKNLAHRVNTSCIKKFQDTSQKHDSALRNCLLYVNNQFCYKFLEEKPDYFLLINYSWSLIHTYLDISWSHELWRRDRFICSNFRNVCNFIAWVIIERVLVYLLFSCGGMWCGCSSQKDEKIKGNYQSVDEEEFDNVDDHSAERDLQRPQMRVDWEQMNELQCTVNKIKSVISRDVSTPTAKMNMKLVISRDVLTPTHKMNIKSVISRDVSTPTAKY